MTSFMGIGVTIGTEFGLPQYREVFPMPGGGTVTSMASLPAPPAAKLPTGSGIMFSVDLMKLGLF